MGKPDGVAAHEVTGGECGDYDVWRRHDWHPEWTVSQDMMPPILSTRFVCRQCGAEAWETSQEGQETTRDENWNEICFGESGRDGG